MSNEATPVARTLPSYITSAVPNPMANRAPWFWDSMSNNGLSVGGLGASLIGIVLGALICHFLFYLVPGLLGMNTGIGRPILDAGGVGTAIELNKPGSRGSF